MTKGEIRTLAHRILISAPYLLPEVDRFLSVFKNYDIEILLAEVQERLSEDALLQYAGNIDGAITGDDQFTARVFEAAAPRLKVISKWGTGIDSIDQESAGKFGVQVYNVPDAFTDAVADSVLGYVLCFARELPWLDHSMKNNEWIKRPGRSLSECTLGVVGVGRIGRAVLARAQQFKMRLLGNDIVAIDESFLSEVDIHMVSLDELFRDSDFISINCDLNSTSRGLVNTERLALMREQSVLINTARGPIVDEQALVATLEAGEIAGAAMDVFEQEPLSADSPLRAMNNVLLAPHNANSSPAAWEAVHREAIRNLFDGLGLPKPKFDSSKNLRAER